jgi:competence protein ComEC
MEGEEGTLFLWLPVAMAAGIGVYFALPWEPGAVATAILVTAAFILLPAGLRHGSAAALLTLLALFGFLTAKLNTVMRWAPPLAYSTGAIDIKGIVNSVTPGRSGNLKIVLRLEEAAGLAAQSRPLQVRLAVAADPDITPGVRVRGRAMLSPLPTPVAPGAFDFARSEWLEGIGATGRFLGRPAIEPGRTAGLAAAVASAIHELRRTIAARIRQVLPGSTGHLAVALVTGERSAIGDAMSDSLQTSGLAHIISISGLHMSLVAGSVFWLVRALLASSAHLAVHRPIKKWAALAALAAGGFYLALSGNEVASQRSYLMLAIIFIAVLLERPALSLRNVAVAALVILTVEPSWLLSAGFQMSFLAVTGLLSFFAFRRSGDRTPQPPRRRSHWPFHLASLGVRWLAVMGATTLIASLCTGPVAAYHFNRVSSYSLVANLLALPIVSAVVMPMALLATVAMPFGLDHWPLAAMGRGIEAVMAVSDWVATFPEARIYTPAQSPTGALIVTLGILWTSLFRTSLRWWGIGLCALGSAVGTMHERPDILVERTAVNAAVRNEFGDLAVAEERRGRFAVERWLAADGDGAKIAQAARRAGWTCDPNICRAMVKGKKIAYARQSAETDLTCPEADVLIAAFPLRERCRDVAIRIDRFDVWRNGAYALFVAEGGVSMTTAQAQRGKRPWVAEAEPRPKHLKNNGSGAAVSSGE